MTHAEYLREQVVKLEKTNELLRRKIRKIMIDNLSLKAKLSWYTRRMAPPKSTDRALMRRELAEQINEVDQRIKNIMAELDLPFGEQSIRIPIEGVVR